MNKIENFVIELKEQIIVLRGEKSQIIEKCTQLKEIHDFAMQFRELPSK